MFKRVVFFYLISFIYFSVYSLLLLLSDGGEGGIGVGVGGAGGGEHGWMSEEHHVGWKSSLRPWDPSNIKAVFPVIGILIKKYGLTIVL